MGRAGSASVMVVDVPSSMGQWGCLAGALAHGALGALELGQARAQEGTAWRGMTWGNLSGLDKLVW